MFQQCLPSCAWETGLLEMFNSNIKEHVLQQLFNHVCSS